jgi:LuxR family maltose regulon positive regulatory protein
MTTKYPITQTKISIPRRRSDLISRQRLLDLLNGFMDTRLAIIAAPAGYGKTSLLIDFAHQSQLPICWQTIDRLDQDILRFLVHFIAAIRKRFPAFGEESFSAIMDVFDETINVDAICTTIVNDLYDHILEHYVIVLDDYHLLGSNQKVEQFISHFINAVDENCHLIIASRALLTLPELPLLVAQSQVGGLSYEELMFTGDEILSLFQQNYHLELTSDAINTLLADTEGWITGLVLATQMYGQETTQLSRIKRVTGISLYDYLSDQVFSRQSDETKTFLLLSSLLEEFDVGLCHEVLAGCMGSPEPDWNALLNYTLKNNLFALPVGEKTISIRYHHLFRDFLQHRALAEYPDISRTILQRLADHHLKNKDWALAHEIYQQLGDHASILEMLISDGSEIQASGNLLALSDWLGGCLETDYKQHPELLSLLGSVRVMRGQVEEGLVCLEKAIPRLLERRDPTHLVRALLRRSDVFRMLGKYQQAIQDAQRALTISNESKTLLAWRARAMRALGTNYYMTGALVKSGAHLKKSLLTYRKLNDTHNTALLSMELGLVYTNLGDYQLAEAAYNEALDLWSKAGNPVWQANLNNNLGVLYHQTGQFIAAIYTLERALSFAKQSGYPRMEAFSLASIGDIYRDLGAITEAEQAYNKSAIINNDIKDRFLVIHLGLAEAELALRKNDPKKAGYLGSQVFEQAQKNASDLELALAGSWLGRFYITQCKPHEAIDVLRSSLIIYDRERDRSNGDTSRLYLAVAHFVIGDMKAASLELSRVLKTTRLFNGWSNIIIPAQQMKSQLHDMLVIDQMQSTVSHILSLVAEYEDKMPALRRQIRQHSLTIPFGPPRLSIRGLGSMQVKLNNRVITNTMWQTMLSRNLFYYLLQHTDGVTKETVGLAFWPDSNPEDMKVRFKNAIYRLRRAIGKEVVQFEDDRYLFNRSLDYEYDVDEFINTLAQADAERETQAKAAYLIHAIHVYKGTFLPGLDLPDINIERERLQQLFENACIQAAELSLSFANYQDSIHFCLRAIEVNPYLETAYQFLFKAYSALGNKAAIIKSYQQLESILREDLSTVPSPETIRLFNDLV